MNKTKIIALSLLTAGALAMTGCGSSSTTTTPPVDANDTNTTPPPPVVVVPDYAKPAPVNAISTQQLIVNSGFLQASNTAAAVTESMTALLTSLITQAGAVAVINTGADVPCAAFGVGQGSGTISAEAHSLPNGTGYSIDFNACTFDTANTLAASTNMMLPPACMDLAEGIARINVDGTEVLDARVIGMLEESAAICAQEVQDGYEFNVDQLGEMVEMLAYVSGLAAEFDEYVPDTQVTALDALNDTILINGSLAANVNLTALPAGNIWDNSFAATNLNMSLFENQTTVKKLNIDMNGELTGNMNVALAPASVALAMGGTNNLSTGVQINSATLNLFLDFGIVGENGAHSIDMGVNLDLTQVPGTWQEIANARFNDSGDGYVRAYFTDVAAANDLEISMYNDNFTQERAVVTDPSAIPTIGVGRVSTYAMNGAFGMNTKGSVPFVWNTQGAFAFNTTDVATKAKYVGLDYAIQSGLISIAGDSTIELQFLPDLGAVNNDGVQDGTVVLRVGADITTLPMGAITWLEVLPQP